jgi:hypothetical protein
VNYFAGSPNNREASNNNNKKFVMVNNDYYNDQFVFITTDDIFNPIIKRQDFANQITLLLDDPDVQTMAQTQPISGSKGTDDLDCTLISNSANKVFCSNWHEMLLLATTATSPTVIDGISTSCNRVIIFGGKKVDGIQTRVTVAEKNNPNNYLEGVNQQAFGDPVNFNFNGVTTFNSSNPSADVMRCLL